MEEFSGKKYISKNNRRRFVSPGLKNNPYLGYYTYHRQYSHSHPHTYNIHHTSPSPTSANTSNSASFLAYNSSQYYESQQQSHTPIEWERRGGDHNHKFPSSSHKHKPKPVNRIINGNKSLTKTISHTSPGTSNTVTSTSACTSTPAVKVSCTCGDSTGTNSTKNKNSNNTKMARNSHGTNKKEDEDYGNNDNDSNQIQLEFYPYNSNMYTSQPGSQLKQNELSSTSAGNDVNSTNLITSKLIPFLPEPFRSTSAYVGSFRHAPSLTSSNSNGLSSSRTNVRSIKTRQTGSQMTDSSSIMELDKTKDGACLSCSISNVAPLVLEKENSANIDLHDDLHNDSTSFKKISNHDGSHFLSCCSPFTGGSSTPSFSYFSSCSHSSSKGRTPALASEDSRFPTQNSINGKHCLTPNLFTNGQNQNYYCSNGTTPKTSFTRSPHNSHYGYSSFSPSFISSSFSSIGKSIPLSASPSTCGIEVYMNQIELSRKHRNAQNKVHSHELALLESLSYGEYLQKMKKCSRHDHSKTERKLDNKKPYYNNQKNNYHTDETPTIEHSFLDISIRETPKRDRTLSIVSNHSVLTSTLSETDEDEALFSFEDPLHNQDEMEDSENLNYFSSSKEEERNREITNESNNEENLELDSCLYSGDYCTVCMALMNRSDIIRLLPCGHIFHMKCIDIWLTGNLSWEGNNTRSCPVCKHTLDFEKLRMERDLDNKHQTETSVASEVSSSSFTSTINTSSASGYSLDDTNKTNIPKWAFVSAIASCSSDLDSKSSSSEDSTPNQECKGSFIKSPTTFDISKGSTTNKENARNSHNEPSTDIDASYHHPASSASSTDDFSLLRTKFSSGIAPPYIEVGF